MTMTLADECGLSNVHHWLLPKKSKVMLYCHSFHSNRCLTSCTLQTGKSASVLKVGVPCGLQSLQSRLAYGFIVRISAQNNFISFITVSLDIRFQFACAAMCSLVMSLCHDIIKYS